MSLLLDVLRRAEAVGPAPANPAEPLQLEFEPLEVEPPAPAWQRQEGGQRRAGRWRCSNEAQARPVRPAPALSRSRRLPFRGVAWQRGAQLHRADLATAALSALAPTWWGARVIGTGHRGGTAVQPRSRSPTGT